MKLADYQNKDFPQPGTIKWTQFVPMLTLVLFVLLFTYR
jgi:hypothetical protein